jgi:hypothetical protein
MPSDETDALAINFHGTHYETGELVTFGTLLMHPKGPAMVMGPEPDREISAEVLVKCMEAAHVMCLQLPDDVPNEDKVRHFAVRALLYQMLERAGLVDDSDDYETLQ